MSVPGHIRCPGSFKISKLSEFCLIDQLDGIIHLNNKVIINIHTH